MRILVTGSAGFIGFHLAKKLLELGHEVIGLDNINDYYDVNLKYARLQELGIDKKEISNNVLVTSSSFTLHQFIKLDIADTEAMDNFFKEEYFDAVCHLAAQAGVRYSLENPHAYTQSNIVGFLNILEGCRHQKIMNLSFASSSSVYGLNESQPFKTSDTTEHPVSLYAATKKSNEMMAHSYSHLYGISATGLRFFTVYGPYGRPDMAPIIFADAISNNRELKVFNHGNMSRDFTYVDDVVQGCIKVINNPAKKNPDWNAKNPEIQSSIAPYKLYNIGHNSPVNLMEFITLLEKKLGRTATKIMSDLQDGDVVSTYADVGGLMHDLGYTPKTSLEEGIDKFVTWYQNFYTKERKVTDEN
ncbi:MAG: NAD-dependent epimerase [Campylobacterota bacterium]|nr:NAD-dependent epimerase [Campylobacterota bacterium]